MYNKLQADRERYKKNRKKLLDQQKEYYIKNKDKIRKGGKNYVN